MQVFQVYMAATWEEEPNWTPSKAPFLNRENAQQYADEINAHTLEHRFTAKVEEEILWFSDEPGYEEYVQTL